MGEYTNPSTTPMTDALSRNDGQLSSWLSTQANRSQITSTVYDLEYPGWAPLTKQVSAKNLRNRVAYTSYTIGSNPLNFNQATFYSYDILGNVDTLIQDYGNNSVGNGTQNMMNANNNRWKKLVYQYDLISGKVNHVAFQPQYINATDGKLYTPNDAFYHKYEYDAENRLTAVYTSIDSVIWEKDARYNYYKHGPLARTTLGDQLVQGTDYAYTLQGWLKGVNSISLLSANDMGGDGSGAAGGNQNQFIGKDQFGYNLNYFNGDYSSINALTTSTTPFPNSNTSSGFKPLYNGNIASMANNINNLTIPGGVANAGGALLYTYKYDQLNRLTSMDVYKGLSNNAWTNPAPRNEYKERISYDANGNIKTYLRNGNNASKITMDNLTYNYNPGTNQLNNVDDLVPDADYDLPGYEDINDQGTNNYGYDAIGNLTSDVSENITNISWNVYGKITQVNYSNTANSSLKNLYYFYDAAGNRICKRVEKYNSSGAINSTYTWYVRDASGNVMATYTSTANGSSNPSNLSVKERHLYGSSRLGILAISKDVKAAIPSYTISTPYKNNLTRGFKYYELTNHLGNILVTVSDKKFGHANGNTIDYYDADLEWSSDYYPFGATMPARSGGVAYRYGFNGKEKDKDGDGGSLQIDYGNRIYDPHLGRFKSVDPLTATYPMLTPYQFASNTPIVAIDLDGLEGEWMSKVIWDARDQIRKSEGNQAAQEYDKGVRAGGIAIAVTAVDIFLTKGWLSRIAMGSQFLGAFEHNRAKTPEGQTAQDKRSKEQLANSVIPFAFGKFIGGFVKVVMASRDIAYVFTKEDYKTLVFDPDKGKITADAVRELQVALAAEAKVGSITGRAAQGTGADFVTTQGLIDVKNAKIFIDAANGTQRDFSKLVGRIKTNRDVKYVIDFKGSNIDEKGFEAVMKKFYDAGVNKSQIITPGTASVEATKIKTF